MNQHTLKTSLSFSGVGLHTGNPVQLRISPAPVDFGICFNRTDLGASLRASLEFVGQTRRSTSLESRGVKVITPEHLLSALYGLGIDNALIDLDAPEVPILDGSAWPYVEAILKAGLVEQDVERNWLVIDKPFRYEDRRSDSYITIEPYEGTCFDVTIDFNSRVVGVQRACFDLSADYAREIAPCRTFCFLQEIDLLRKFGLIKGGSLDNALVIDEPKGYVGGKKLFFDNELARHKLLDLMGDCSLLGQPIRGKVTAWKPGHKVNTQAFKKFLETI